MLHKTENPKALAGASGLDILNFYKSDFSTTNLVCPAVGIIARRYRLTPSTAKLICSLAGIGGELR